MKKTNFTHINPSWYLDIRWLREIIPLLALFVLFIPMQVQAQGTQAPNCSNFSPAIDGDGDAIVSARDFLTNAANAVYPVTVTVKDPRFGGGIVIKTFEFPNIDATESWAVCNYLDRRLEFSASNSVGNCNRGFIDVNGTPPPVLTSAWQDGDPDLSIGNNKKVVYCGNVPAPDTRSEEHTSELQSRGHLVCRLL